MIPMKTSVKNRPIARRTVWRTGIAAAIVAVSSINAFSQAFTPGNLVVVQGGDGVQSLSSSGNAIFLDQFTTSGTLVSSLALPTNGPSAFIQAINSITEGFINLTPNGQGLVLAGYNVSYGYTNASISSASAAAIPRAVCTVDVNGNFSLVTNSRTLYSGANIRSAAGDNNFNFWAEGSSGGMAYMGIGNQSAITGTVLNSRVIQLIGGNLYYSTGSDKRGIIMVNGTPTIGPANTNYIVPTGTFFNSTAPSPYAFVFDPGMTVCYVADSNNYTNSATIGGIEKWVNNGSGTFVYAYTLQPVAGNNNGAVGLAVSFGSTTNIYGTLANNTNLFSITDTGPSSVGSVIYTSAANQVLRGVCFAPTNGVTPVAPAITAITPPSQTVNVDSTATFTVLANAGVPAASNLWYQISNSVTRLIPGATGTTLTLTNLQATASGGYYVVLTNSSTSVTSAVATLTVAGKPTISAILPTSVTTNVGATVIFTLTSNAGNPPASNFWYAITGTPPNLTTNLIAGATGPALTLNDVVGGNSGSYFAILTNSSGSATSTVATLTVTGDPSIGGQPANTYGLLDGTIYFSVGVFATSPHYQWYYSDGAGNLTAPVVNGATTLSGVSVIYGATSSTLSISNLQYADLPALTNLAVVVTNVYGSVTSSVASLLTIYTTGAPLAFWDFNGLEFTNTAANPTSISSPVPYLGSGTAFAVGTCNDPGTSPFSGSVDANNGNGFDSFPAYVYPDGFPAHAPPFSWGTSAYPLTGSNKLNGVQFNVSTVGAKNIRLSYESRVSATASDYERVQYTTNGTDWVDYPTSSTFGGVGSTYLLYTNDLTGFPGVANNPNFGVRVVTEFQSTATYGVGATNNYVGTANTYGTSGTVTYDVVTFFGDAITNAYFPPTIVGLVDTNTLDYVSVTNNFTISDATEPLDQLTLSAVALNTTVINPTFTFTGTGANRSLIVTPNTIPVSVAATPIMVTVTDTNGDSTVQWFTLTLTSSNLPPTNSLTLLKGTNTLANKSLTIPFIVGDDHTPVSQLTDFSVASGNNTLIPAANIVVGNTGTANPTVTITPAHNQLGVGTVSVTLSDDDATEPKSTTATIPFTVRPNTNVVAIDYFTYDNSPPNALDAVSSGFWTHLSGNFGQLKVNIDAGLGAPNTARVDATANTENLQTALIGAPYKTNSGAILYASYTINMPDPTKMPLNNGTYVTALNDGSLNTANVDCLLVVSTNNAAPGNYRVGIANTVGANGTNSVQFPMDLVTSSNYVIVTALSLTNGFSTLWVNPGDESSPSVTDTTAIPTLFNISEFELRESGQPNGGQVNVGSLKVGTTFDSVFPSLHVQQSGTNAIVTWSDPTLNIQATPNLLLPFVDVTGATAPYTNSLSPNNTMFFRFGQ